MGRGERSSPSHTGRGTVLGGCCGHVVNGYMQHLPQTVPFPCRRPITAAVHDIPFHITHITTNDRALSLINNDSDVERQRVGLFRVFQ